MEIRDVVESDWASVWGFMQQIVAAGELASTSCTGSCDSPTVDPLAPEETVQPSWPGDERPLRKATTQSAVSRDHQRYLP